MSQDLIKGSIASRYTFIRPLGKGTGGAVVLARDTFGGENELVAIKLLDPSAADGVEGQMILREFDILSQLRHPHLVEVRDFGPLDNGGLFLAEEFIEGFSLQDARIGSDRELNAIVLEILSALAYLHEIGIVHRDIKPANIMVLRLDDPHAPPHAMLVDFGLSSSDPSRDRLWGGTRFFMAPEVRRRESATPRSDLFSLGVSLYYLLCGVQPIPDSSDQEDAAVIAPHILNTKISLPFSRFIMVLLRQVNGVDLLDASEAMSMFYNDVIPKQFQTFLDGGVDPVFSSKVYARFENHFLQKIYSRTATEILELQDQQTEGNFVVTYSPRQIEAERVALMVQNHRKRQKLSSVELNPRTANLNVSWILKLMEALTEISATFNLDISKTYRWNYHILKAYAVLYGEYAASELGEALDDLPSTMPPFDVDHYITWFDKQFEFVSNYGSHLQSFYFIRNLNRMTFEKGDLATQVLQFLTSLPFGSLLGTAADCLTPLHLSHAEQIPSFQANTFESEHIQHFIEALFDPSLVKNVDFERALAAADQDVRYVAELPYDLDLNGFRPNAYNQSYSAIIQQGSYKPPESLTQIYRRRFLEMSEHEKRVLEVLAALETDIDWVVLREILNEGEIPVEKIDLAIYSLIYRLIAHYQLINGVRIIRRPAKEMKSVVLAPLSKARIKILQRRICDTMIHMCYEGRVTPRDLALQLDALQDYRAASDYWYFAGQKEQLNQSLEPTAMVASCAAFAKSVQCMMRNLEQYKPEIIAARRAGFAQSLIKCAQITAAHREIEAAWKKASPQPVPWLKYRIIVVGLSLAQLCGNSEQFDVWEDRAAREIPTLLDATEFNLLFAWRDRLICSYRTVFGRLDRELLRAKHLNDYRLETYILSEVGLLWEELDDIPAAVHYYKTSIRTAKEHKVNQASVLAFVGYGRLQGRLGNKEQAISSLVIGFRHAIRMARADLAGEALYNIASIYMRAEAYDEAIRFSDHLTYIAHRLKHPELQGKASLLSIELKLTMGTESAKNLSHSLQKLAEKALRPSFESNWHSTFRRETLNLALKHGNLVSEQDLLIRYQQTLDSIDSSIAAGRPQASN